ncbi:MAG: large subunit ribosomal protein L19e [Candidatus Woesearchaeota archaeon]|nr:large subunit ribosomal protein L19e [Candidatus Woesearchaeota archaeon]MDN5327994.1 large subunit ribosomal protein L19e [Candidatus Woesearchaeota archaeon]
MDLKSKKRIAASILNCSPYRVIFDEEHLDEIKEAITREDIKILIHKGFIRKKQVKGISKVRFVKLREQKKKGHRKGHGSRKGKKTARNDRKEQWMNRVRKQRAYLKELKEKQLISPNDYRLFYRRVKGGVFRSLRHLKLYLSEKGIIKKSE